jgi:hypothetical protein
MYKILAAGIAAVLLVGTVMIFSGATTTEAHSTPVSLKGDRLDAKPFGPDCSQASWPFYEASCLRSTVKATREAKPVRIVAISRAQ